MAPKILRANRLCSFGRGCGWPRLAEAWWGREGDGCSRGGGRWTRRRWAADRLRAPHVQDEDWMTRRTETAQKPFKHSKSGAQTRIGRETTLHLQIDLLPFKRSH